MNEASALPAQATRTVSAHARKLADELNLDIEGLEGTGPDGLVTKADVQALAETKAQTNIMDKAKLERHNAAEAATPEVPGDETVVVLPSQEELLQIIKEMRGEIEDLREAQAGLIERENHTRDLTDDMFFIAKPNGHRWEERRVIDNKTVSVEFVGTAFYGPFEEEEDIDKYVAAKRLKRQDSYIDWQNIQVMSGRDARALDREEKEEREAQFASNAPVNILDRRIFAAQHQGHVPGVGKALDDPDTAGPAPYRPAGNVR